MKPLTFLPISRDAVVRDITGGNGAYQRLSGMGLARGAVVRVVRNDGYGPLIVALGEGRLILGRGIAQKVLVEEI